MNSIINVNNDLSIGTLVKILGTFLHLIIIEFLCVCNAYRDFRVS